MDIYTNALDNRGPLLARHNSSLRSTYLQEYLAHTKTTTPLEPSWDPRHRPTVGS